MYIKKHTLITVSGMDWSLVVQETPLEISYTGPLPTRLQFYEAFRTSPTGTGLSVLFIDVLYCLLQHAHAHEYVSKAVPAPAEQPAAATPSPPPSTYDAPSVGVGA